MSQSANLTLPRTHQLAIGEQVGSSDTLIGVVERVGAPNVDTIEGLLQNHGPTPFTFSVATGKASSGSIVLTGQPSDGDTIVIDDGPNAAVTFEFDSNASVTESATLRRVVPGATLAQTVAALVAAINAAPALNVTAGIHTLGPGASTASIPLRNDATGTVGNVTITKSGSTIAVTGMSGGTGAAKNIRVNANGTPSAVSSVVVAAGARVPFSIEIAPSDVQDFLNFFASTTPAGRAFGTLTLSYKYGELVRRERFA